MKKALLAWLATMLWAPTQPPRVATAAPVVLRSLGQQPDLRRQIRSCGLFPIGSRQLDSRAVRILGECAASIE